MSGCKALVGVVLLCAIASAALGVADASASGLTAVACREVEPETGKYLESHCQVSSPGGSFATVELPFGEGTEVESEAVGETRLTVQLGLNKAVVTCQEMRTTSGSLTNIEEEGEMKAHGTGIVFSYVGCHVALESNTEHKCPLENLASSPLTAITGPEHEVSFKSESENIIEFTIPKECLSSQNRIAVGGSLVGQASTETPSHITFTREGTVGALKSTFGFAYYEGTHVSRMREGEETVGLETF
jgi:hypothetical protein